MIVIIDYDMGNVRSILNMMQHFTNEVIISSDPAVIESADKLILPGVGSFDTGILNLKKLNLINILSQKVLLEKVPILGICLGMQLFTSESEEGKMKGLGWINGKTVKFRFQDKKKYKVPHMGWNTVKQIKKSNLLNNLETDSRFYFAHSYFLECKDYTDVILTTNYGIEFTSAIQRDNIFGVQFHPEKSHKFGLNLLKNFVYL